MTLDLLDIDGPTWVTPQQAAELSGVRLGTIQQWVHRGHLHPVREGAGRRARMLLHLAEVTRRATTVDRRITGV